MAKRFNLKKILAPVDDVVRKLKHRRDVLMEEVNLLEFCNRWLTDADRENLGRAMAARRKVAPPPRL